MGRLGSWMTPFLAARSQLIPSSPLDALGLFFPEHGGTAIDRLPESLAAYMKPVTFCRALTREAIVGETIMLDLSGDHNDLFNVTIPGWMNPDSSQITIYELKTLTKVPAHLLFTCDAPGMFDLYFGVLTSDTVKKLWGLTFSVCRANIACLDSVAQSPTSFPPADYHSTEFMIDLPNFAETPVTTTTPPATSTISSAGLNLVTATTAASSTSEMSQTSTRTEAVTAQSVTALTAQVLSQFRQNLNVGAQEPPADSDRTETQRRVVAVGTHRHNHGSGKTSSSTATTRTAAQVEPPSNPNAVSLATSGSVDPADQAMLKKPPGVPQEAWDWFLSTRGNRSHGARDESARLSRVETTALPRTILVREVVVPSPASEIIVVSDIDATNAAEVNVTTPDPTTHPATNKLLTRLRKDRAANVSHPILHRRDHSPEGEEDFDEIEDDYMDDLPPQISVRAPPGALNVYLEPAPINPEIVQRLTEEVNSRW